MYVITSGTCGTFDTSISYQVFLIDLHFVWFVV
jgi:hypothetical protein